jgi:hypothetical protein
VTAAAKLALITALGVERQVLAQVWPTSSAADHLLLHSGIGVAKARLGVERALGNGATSVLLLGFAGGLNDEAVPGTLLVPRQVRYQSNAIAVNTDYHQRVCAAVASLQPVTEPLLCADVPLCTPAAKAAHAAGAFACDMESAAIAAAHEAGIAAAVVKVVLDGPEDVVPELALQFTDADGNRRLPSLSANVLSVVQWWQLFGLLPRFRQARQQLRAAAEQLSTNAGNFA